MNNKFQQLAELGAGGFQHIDGTLLEHLTATQKLLEKWGASTVLRDAGLYHAAYGTEGFEGELVSISRRGKIAAIIGEQAEEIVYQYCACDRKTFFMQILNEAANARPLFANRFTRKSYHLSESMLANFCELTAANETELAIDNPAFLAEQGSGLNKLFKKMTPWLSPAAITATEETFGKCQPHQ